MFGSADGFVVRNEAPGGKLLVVVGEPGREVLDEALRERADGAILCSPESEPHLGRRLEGWTREAALLFELREPEALAPEESDVRALTPEDPLDHLPAELREELEGVAPSNSIWTAFCDGVPASFAYAYWRTEGLFDLSIDTAPDFRRQGLARRAASECIRQERKQGREPVWGAMESNAGSRRLAASLGFVEHDQVVLFSRG